MHFQEPLKVGKFLKRYKRFFADIELDGDIITAHVPNTGSMKSCLYEKAECLLTYNDDPKRKLKYTLQLIKGPDSWIGVNTHLPNKLVLELAETSPLKHWNKFTYFQPETKINDKTRIDFVFLKEAPETKINHLNYNDYKCHFVEVKNVTLVENNIAYFPDSVSTRAQKHLEELMDLMANGHSAELVLTVQRNDASIFKPAAHIDPEYAKLFNQAIKKGMTVTAIPFVYENQEIRLDPTKKIEVIN